MTDYIAVNRKGDRVECYGEVEENSNFEVICEDECNDWVCMGIDGATTWREVAKHITLETYDVVEICAI